MNSATLSGPIPANVLLRARASVTAGLAKEVDEVNQYLDGTPQCAVTGLPG